MTSAILDRIVAATRDDLAERQSRVALEDLRRRAALAPAPSDFLAAVRPIAGSSARVIAEIKRASPSRGVIATGVDPVAQAQAYAAGGAAAISVLTEPHFFGGSLDDLAAVRAAVALPILRKDFLLDPYQVHEARAVGADAVLLLCSLLDDVRLAAMIALARDLGMQPLVEAHTAAEAQRAVTAGARIIGLNSRDLRTFALDPQVIRDVASLIPADRILVAESGLHSARDVAHARAWGADAVLVGEEFMRASRPAELVHELATAGGGQIAALLGRRQRPWVKICGLTTAAQIATSATAGADAIGLVFAPMAPPHRRVTVEQAAELAQALRDNPAPQPLAVGIFVNETAAQVAAVARHVGLDAIQLSGDESPDECAEILARAGLPVLKAIRLRAADDLATLEAFAQAGALPLLDTPKAGSYGGTGETGDWELARAAALRWPIILSGGLSPDNVAHALRATRACGVDVSSGVETAKAKDNAKIERFIATARGYAAREAEQVQETQEAQALR